jgi:two-component system sensor histidine kinase BaeS
MGVLLLVQIVLLSVGTLAVLRLYRSREVARLSEEALSIIMQGTAEVSPHDGPFFVFSGDRSIIYSNRGRGRSIDDAEMIPLRLDGTVVGYYYAEQVRFLSTAANRFVLVSLSLLIVGSTLTGLLIAGAAARRNARTIAGSLSLIENDLLTLKAVQPVETRESQIEEVRRISENLHWVSLQLVDQEAYKRRWMQDISHDLRTPLSGLRSQLEGMLDGVFQASKDRLERTLSDVARIESMVDSISELHALETTRSLVVRPMNAAQFLDSITDELGGAVTENGASITARAETEILYANESLLRRAIENIVANALRYGGENISIDITVSSEGSESVISICNDGSPIPEDQLPRLFQRFFRGQFGRSSSGSGLGLSIAHEIAVLHGGTVTAHNGESGGVCFHIRLPVNP